MIRRNVRRSLRRGHRRQIAEHFAGKAAVDDGVKEAEARGTDLTLTVPAPREKADRIIEKLAPELGERLRGNAAPDGQFLAVAIGDGKITGRLQQKP